MQAMTADMRKAVINAMYAVTWIARCIATHALKSVMNSVASM